MRNEWKEKLKKIHFVRNLGKKFKNIRSYYYDMRDFNEYYIEAAENSGDFSYTILLLVHSLEKGMCMEKLRPFGFQKVNELKTILAKTKNRSSFEYQLGIAVLISWTEVFEENNWIDNKEYLDTKLFLRDKETTCLAGKRVFEPNVNKTESYLNFISTRHSVRDFDNKTLKDEDIEVGIKCFQATPTACNRQMCRIIEVKSADIKKELLKVLIGIQGFNENSVHFFVITYDIASLAYSGERQQGFFNAGLCTMNFINGLHSRGVGTCCLQWSNDYKEDEKMRILLGMKHSERIAVVIGAGYYLKHNVVPYSNRREIKDLLRVV